MKSNKPLTRPQMRPDTGLAWSQRVMLIMIQVILISIFAYAIWRG
jgi:hypothetical protein